MAMSELKQRLLQDELVKVGFRDTVYEPQNDVIRININEERRMLIYDNNDINYLPPDRDSALYTVRPLVDKVKEIVAAFENAPAVPFENLEHYRILAEYSSVVMAARDDGEYGNGLHFVTWQYNYDRAGFEIGNYTQDYAAAKEDFALRSGLVPREKLFTQEQAAEIKTVIENLFENDYDLYLSYEKTDRLNAIIEQLDDAYPEIRASIKEERDIEIPDDNRDTPRNENAITAEALNGEIKPGDWVIATLRSEYRSLIGMVTSIEGNDVQVDFSAFDYPDWRTSEIEELFEDISGEYREIGELPLNDITVSSKMLINISYLGSDEIERMGNHRENCESFCASFKGGGEVPENPKQIELNERIDKNLSDYHTSLMGFGKQEIIDMAGKISAMSEAHDYLTNWHGFRDGDGELDFYLKFQNPLEVVADAWRERTEDIDDMSFVLNNLYDKQDALVDYPLISEADLSKNNEIDEQKSTSERGMTEYEFKKNMADIIPDVDSEAMQNLINYANELAESGTTTKSEFFRDTFLEYILVTRHFEPEITKQLLDVCKTFALNHFELRGAAENLRDGAEIEKIAQMAIDGKCDNGLSKADVEYRILLQEFENKSFGYPCKNENITKTPSLSEKSDKTAEKPKTLEEKLNAAKEKAKAQDTQNSDKKSNKREERD